MDGNRDLQLLLRALRDRAIDPGRLADATGDWTPASGGGLMTHLVDSGVLTPDDLHRLEATAAGSAATVAWDGPPTQTVPYQSGDGHAADGRDGPPAGSARYEVLRLHQTGGLGQVWLARDRAVGRDVALKTVRPDRAGDPGTRARFVREARVTGRLEHPSIVPLYDLAGGAEPFYVMRFVTGRTLAEAAADYHRRRADGRAGRSTCRPCSTPSSPSATRSPSPTPGTSCTAT